MNETALIFDVDWAPDFAVEYAVEILASRNVKSTWFATHESRTLHVMRAHSDLFELGIHPNFLPGSTHGSSPAEVLSHCMELVPEAASVRSHSLVQSTVLLDHIMRRGTITADVSTFLPRHPALQACPYRRGGRELLRVPAFWGDSYEMHLPAPSWRPEALLTVPGLKVFSFHPMHLYLNSPSPETYEKIKRNEGSVRRLSKRGAEASRHRGEGAASFFERLLALCSGQGVAPVNIRDLRSGEASGIEHH